MKKSKQQFDDLVTRIKSGKEVSFGEMEKVYAEAFLESFLEKSKKQRERAIASLRRQQREFQDEYDYDEEIEDSFSIEAIDRQELDYLRNIVETLGVKPSIDKLHQYTERAIQRSDWNLLGDVLSVSQEGNLGFGTLETLAVNELSAGRIPSYKELKKQFPEIEISSDKVNQIYTQLLSFGHLGKLKEIREEINMPVPEEVCQSAYENLLSRKNKSSIRAIHEIKDVTGVAPKKTESVKEAFKGLYNAPETDLEISDLDLLNELFGLYSDIELATSTQKSALESERIDDFAHLWNRSNARFSRDSQKDVANKYTVLDQKKDYDSILKLIEITRISPKGEIFSRTASSALEKARDLEGVKLLIDIAGETPEFAQNSVDNFSERVSLKGDAESLIGLLKLGGKIKPEYVHNTALRIVEKDYMDDFDDFNDLEQKVNNFYKTFKLKPTAKVSGAKVSKLTNTLEKCIAESIQEFTRDEWPKLDPLTPVKGSNLGQHNKFKSKVKKLIKEYSIKAKKIRSKNPNLEIGDSTSIRNVYAVCLELNLAQSLIGDEYLKLEGMVNSIGVSQSRESVRKAVYNHVTKNSSYIENNPESLLQKISTVGLGIEVDPVIHNQVASDLVSNSDNIENSLSYLKRLTGIKDFSEQVYNSARSRIVRDLLKINLSQYNSLKEFGIDVKTLSEGEKGMIARGIISELREKPFSINNAEKIVELTDIQLKADSYELRGMIRKYFDGGRENIRPSRIARLVNQELDRDQIFNREIELIHEGYTSSAKELYQDTGIHPTEQGARTILNKYREDSREEIKRRLNFVFGQNSGLS